MIILGVILFFFQILDIITTKIALKNNRLEEGNFFFKKSINNRKGFSYKLISFKIILALFLTYCLVLITHIITNIIMIIVDIFYGIIILNNIIKIIMVKLEV